MEGKAWETWKQHTWLDFLFEIILTSESGAQVDQRKAGRSEKFLAQEPKTPKDLSAAPGQRGVPASRWDEVRDVGRGQI